jgi:hypothetical protein
VTEEFKHICTCQMCGIKYQMGRHIYEGKHIATYDLDVCSICYQGNWDGWNSSYEQKLLSHLKEKKLPIPKRNEKGWLPRG